jgi:hypothetical protein
LPSSCPCCEDSIDGKSASMHNGCNQALEKTKNMASSSEP